MTVRASIDMFSAAWKGISDEHYVLVRVHFPELPEANPKDYCYQGGDTVIDVADAMDLMATTGIQITLKPHKGCRSLPEGLMSRVAQLETEGHLVRAKLNSGEWGVQIHVPNFWLHGVNDVILREDYCTDALQTDLDAGWRILCICPPLDERRPTYILGRAVSK